MDSAALDDIALFAELTDAEREEVAAALRDVTVDAGAMLAAEHVATFESEIRGVL